MFAVPGWNISAPLKTQTEGPGEKRGKKRKRKERTKGGETATERDDGGTAFPIQTEQALKNDSGHFPQVDNKAQQLDGRDGTKPTEAKRKSKKSKSNSYNESNNDISASAREQKALGQEARPGNGLEASRVLPLSETAIQSSGKTVSTQTKTPTKLTPLQAAMHQKLASARFRHLNQTLYTTESQAALDLFTQNPDMFNDYHAGFAQQVAVWPENPVDRFVADVISRGQLGLEKFSKKEIRGKKDKRTRDAERTQKAEWESSGVRPLPRDHRTGHCTIADLGCGTASFSSRLQPSTRPPPKGLNLKIHSFDLHAPSPLVTVADIANLPLSDGSVDIAVFCLALMGTNWVEFVDEAWRVLKWKGECWISEIKSRFGRAGGEKKVVGHSVGSQNKKKDKRGRKTKSSQDADGEELPQNVNGRQGYVNDEIDDPETHAQRTEQTDIGPFVDVMRRHGFTLSADADMSNKMFVKMVFVKAVKPTLGKNMRKEDTESKPLKTGKRFLEGDADENFTVEEEGKVLKPCVYKLR
jgi:ribosomal RNA-processing protein 8